MQDEVLVIDLPKYNVDYVDEIYSYKPGKGRENLKSALYKASEGYCMYCYNRIKIDENEYGHLEHAIEKVISEEKLKNCIPNIGISCSVCNDKYKKRGEKYRQPEKSDIQKYNENAKCGIQYCTKPCVAYTQLKQAYLKNKDARFLMQPLGVKSTDIGIKEKRELCLQYDIMEAKFIPSKREDYSEEEIEFLHHHIAMFHLNTVERKSTQLIKFLKDTIQYDGHYSELEYNNQVVELFVKQILKEKEPEEVLKICEKLYTYASLKFNA